jgi:hypothetical protein
MMKKTIPTILLLLTACASNPNEILTAAREADEAVTAEPVETAETVETSNQSNVGRLSELDALVERGLISEEEYQEARRRILGI